MPRAVVDAPQRVGEAPVLHTDRVPPPVTTNPAVDAALSACAGGDPAAFVGATHVTDAERSRLRALLDSGYVDAYRALHPDEQQFTWWDYRQGHFHRGMGLRIDLALVGRELAGALRRCGIERDFRKGLKPSDHAPLVVELDA